MRGRRCAIAGLVAFGLAAAGCEPAATRAPDHPGPGGPGAPNGGVMATNGPAPPAPWTPAAPRMPAASRRQLPSGANVAVVEDRDAPRVALRLVVSAGTSSDTERAGAAIVAANMVAIGIEDRVAGLGARLVVEVGPDVASFAIDALPDQVGPAIDLLAGIVKAPAVGAPQVTRAVRRAALEAKRRGAEDDDHGAAYVIVRDAYDLPTARHPYGTTSATAAELAEVTPQDVRLITTARYVPGGATLIVVGDVAASDVMAAAERALGGGAPKVPPRLDLTEPFAREHDRVTLLDRPGAPTAHVFVGIPGPATDDPVALAGIELAAEVVAARLGSGATAMLYDFDEGPHIARIDLRTSPPRATAEVAHVKDEIERVASEAPAAEEITSAKRRLLGRAARALASNDGIADAMAAHGAGSTLEKRLAALSAATPEVVSIAAQSLARAKAHVVVAADAKQAAQVLTAIAEVKVLDPRADYTRLRSVQAAR